MAVMENKNVNPIVAVLASWFLPGLGLVILGQGKKGWMLLATTFIATLLCCIPGWVVAIMGMIEAYKVAKAVEDGETIDEHEYKIELLYKVCKILHKEAIFKG